MSREGAAASMASAAAAPVADHLLTSPLLSCTDWSLCPGHIEGHMDRLDSCTSGCGGGESESESSSSSSSSSSSGAMPSLSHAFLDGLSPPIAASGTCAGGGGGVPAFAFAGAGAGAGMGSGACSCSWPFSLSFARRSWNAALPTRLQQKQRQSSQRLTASRVHLAASPRNHSQIKRRFRNARDFSRA